MNSRYHRSFLFASAAAIATGSAFAQTVVLSDSFEVDSSADYTLVDAGAPDGTQTFAFDYVAAGVPLAPRSTAGDLGGLRLTVNDAAGASDGMTVFHNTDVSALRYRLTVDVWSNYAEATGGTTEYAQVGVAGDAVTPNSIFAPSTGSGSFLAFTGDGGAATDYGWFRDCANIPTGELACNTIDHTHPSYLGNGANHVDAFFQALFPSPPSTRAGSAGNIWTTVEIDVDNFAGVISFSFDGVLTYQGNFGSTFDGNVSMGLYDQFSSVDNGSNFVIFDNLVVETLLTPIGTSYCMAVANSTGVTGVITALGTTVATDNNVTLNASSLSNGSFGFFLTSMAQGFVMNPGGSTGNLCLGGSIGRYVGPGQIQNSGATGEIALVLDLTMTPTPMGLVSVQAGETWNFTTWHRDAVGGVATSNFTDGVEILFQ